MSAESFIDLGKVIAGKNPRLLKILPWFVMNYLKKIIHVDSVNDFLAKNQDVSGIDFANAVLEELGAEIIVYGLENIPATDRFIVASNHPLGGLDGLALISVIGRVRKDVVFPVNDLLMALPNFKGLFIPINKHGRNTENIRIMEKSFASDTAMLYFPAGLCSRKQSGHIIDLEWKKTIISKARQHKRDVIPVHIDGRNSGFFYNLSNFRKKVGIKANIEMFFLVNEMYKQRNQTLTFRIGKPIPYKKFDKRFSDKEWASLVKKHVYQLNKNEKKEFLH
ncbi:MAG: 1-acyl-sn-glycerol-3-phosphate acyltransferase [Bacteroidales bacterium]|nr:1-acyl-sn-glycerol-3-phosphate acyltransferase [Bacteroidales bacterium]